MNKDFLIVSREWHDSLPCPTREGQPGGVLGLGLFLQSYHFFTLTHSIPIFLPLCRYLNFRLIYVVPFFDFFSYWFCRSSRRHFELQPCQQAKPRQNTPSRGVYTQRRVAHLILECTPLSSSFQALKCVIKAKDPRLHLINVAISGFLNPGLRPQGVLKVEPILQYKAKNETTPSQPAVKGEEEE